MVKKSKKMSKKVSKDSCKTSYHSAGCHGCGYGLGIIGAAVYYLSSTVGFWNGFLGLLKALVWPAFLVFEVLKYVGA